MTTETLQFAEMDLGELEERHIGVLALLTARANAKRDGLDLPAEPEDGYVADMRERLAEPNVWLDVAVHQEEIVGLALGYPRTETGTPPSTEYLSLLMVEPDYWSNKIGSTLLDRFVIRARDAGRERVTLRTRADDNHRAQEVYEHKGFVLSGATKESQYGLQIEYQLHL